jgi:adhesin transport system membrane fusion protein
MALPAPATLLRFAALPDHLVPDDLRPARIASLGFGLVVAMSASILLWAALTRLPTSVTAPARLVPSGRLQIASHPRGGTLARVHVQPGQAVPAGAPLLSLAADAATADWAQSERSREALDARIAALQAELGGTRLQLSPALMAAAPAQVAAEQALHAARLAERDAEQRRAAATREAAAQALASIAAEARAREAAAQQARRELTLMQGLVDRGLEPRISLERAAAASTEAEAAASAASAAVRRARAAEAETGAEAARLATARRATAAAALAAATAERAALAAARPALQAERDRTVVRAPAAGIVNRVLVNTPGSAIAAGAPLVELLPRHQPLEVEALLAPADIGFVHPGQKARVRITAYDAASFGTARATVRHVSPDAIADPRTGASHYEVRLALDPRSLPRRSGQPLPLSAGMVAEVSLLGPERSVLAYLAAPFARLQDQAFRER